VLAGVKDIRDAVQQAQLAATGMLARATMVFVDEVHRFNKAQQDAFLPHVESGLITFVGATTENPSFEVNNALLSRAQVYVLRPLDAVALAQVLARVQAHFSDVALATDARDYLLRACDGDARKLINAAEAAFSAARASATTELSLAALKQSLGSVLRQFDQGGDLFYDSISALHKAVRGSDPDAALYWLMRMLDGGADARYIARRMVRMASEDIGLADPRALALCIDAAASYERLGAPEGELALAQAVIYLAVAAKSNAVYRAYKAARALIAEGGTHAVPLHLRNAPTALMRALQHGQDYRYDHDESDAFAAGQSYWPDTLPAQQFYTPTDRGLEQKIAEKLAQLRARTLRT
jgi:putative ATPase